MKIIVFIVDFYIREIRRKTPQRLFLVRIFITSVARAEIIVNKDNLQGRPARDHFVSISTLSRFPSFFSFFSLPLSMLCAPIMSHAASSNYL